VTAHTHLLGVSGSYTYRFSTTFFSFPISSTESCHFFTNIYILTKQTKILSCCYIVHRMVLLNLVKC